MLTFFQCLFLFAAVFFVLLLDIAIFLFCHQVFIHLSSVYAIFYASSFPNSWLQTVIIWFPLMYCNKNDPWCQTCVSGSYFCYLTINKWKLVSPMWILILFYSLEYVRHYVLEFNLVWSRKLSFLVTHISRCTQGVLSMFTYLGEARYSIFIVLNLITWLLLCYSQDYFDDLAKYLRVGPPLYFVVKDFNYRFFFSLALINGAIG